MVKYILIIRLTHSFAAGYGFVDFESGTCADAAVKGLQAKGVQAQMAKVGIPVQRRAATVRLLHGYLYYTLLLYALAWNEKGFKIDFENALKKKINILFYSWAGTI